MWNVNDIDMLTKIFFVTQNCTVLADTNLQPGWLRRTVIKLLAFQFSIPIKKFTTTGMKKYLFSEGLSRIAIRLLLRPKEVEQKNQKLDTVHWLLSSLILYLSQNWFCCDLHILGWNNCISKSSSMHVSAVTRWCNASQVWGSTLSCIWSLLQTEAGWQRGRSPSKVQGSGRTCPRSVVSA